MCRNARCRRAGCCRGEPERCFATKLRIASSAVRNLANRMIQEQRLGADVDEAIEDDLEVYLAWTAGLMAARESGPA